MTPDEIRIAVAECDGWRRNGHLSWFHSDQGQKTSKDWDSPDAALPDYYASRDACAQFEAGLSPSEKDNYALAIYNMVHKEFVPLTTHNMFDAITATAPQRCEAYLKLRNKWRDGDKSP